MNTLTLKALLLVINFVYTLTGKLCSCLKSKVKRCFFLKFINFIMEFLLHLNNVATVFSEFFSKNLHKSIKISSSPPFIRCCDKLQSFPVPCTSWPCFGALSTKDIILILLTTSTGTVMLTGFMFSTWVFRCTSAATCCTPSRPVGKLLRTK